jgi:hypothetical protein
MSVIIKGMEMPKSCDSCDLIQFDDEGLEAHCPLSPYYRWCGTPPDYRPEGCQLVEVPTPHGRLIDENELLRHKYGFSQTARVIIKTTDAVIEAEVSE